MKKRLLIILLSIGIGFHVFAQKSDYKARLTKVEVQGKVTADSSNIKVDSTINAFNPQYIFTDKDIDIIWLYALTEFDFILTNKSEQTIKIIWDDAAYIDKDGTTHKIFHKGVKYLDRNNSQPPSGIIKGAKISDLIAPTDYAYYSSGSYGGWQQTRLFEKPKRHQPALFDNITSRILLPISFNGTTIEYIFTFSINWFEEVKKKKG
ncbi:hypothetical protein SAMN05421821_105186 [Mucilaginibacter lappiensis]|uniref:Uncharacterized protein n=1 Tax=Mucilaginibacter lappiensis TaxID=354630 RepID=A0ABR6PJI4_9SPHI|nr:hypothetical protein [Mucilaginibacter lappiensis]MBB6109768.1 hypothetical protein [Mucilaginibacter lappiensis]SIR14885.1 hypothetical protein SAMN05421821_105186 [Mucilaginibacter lappiensis]